MGNNARFAGAGASEDKQWALGGLNCGALLGIEMGEKGMQSVESCGDRFLGPVYRSGGKMAWSVLQLQKMIILNKMIILYKLDNYDRL